MGCSSFGIAASYPLSYESEILLGKWLPFDDFSWLFSARELLKL